MHPTGLVPVLSAENRGEVLPRFFHRSKREAAEVAAELRPREDPPVRDVVTAVHVATPSAKRSPPPVQPAMSISPAKLKLAQNDAPAVQLAEQPDANSAPSAPEFPTSPQESREVIEPLNADLRRLHITVSRQFLDKLAAARDALSHSHPGAGTEEILSAGLDLLLARDAKRKGLVDRPRVEAPPAKPEHVPAHVKRAVWKRDGGKCQWKMDSGELCGSTVRVQLYHVVPRARGGPSTVANVRLLCAVHNQLAARLAFGDGWMDLFLRERAPRESSAPDP